MKVLFHPDFPKDIRAFQAEYVEISTNLGKRFRQEIDDAIEAVIAQPTSAGHFLNLGTEFVKDFRRRNLRSFPHFLLYGITEESLIFGSVIPSRSDPLMWLKRF